MAIVTVTSRNSCRAAALISMVGVGRSVVVGLVALLLLAGCGSQTFRVAPEVVDEVRSIGKVVAETRDGIGWDEIEVVDEILVFDVGATSEEEALSKASDLLQRKGWGVTSKSLGRVEMESPKWSDNRLTYTPVNMYDFGDQPIPRVARAIRDVGARSEALIVVEIYRTDP